MAVLRKEPGIWNQQSSGFNPSPSTGPNVASYPPSSRLIGPEPACPCTSIIYSLCLGFSIRLSGGDEAIPPHALQISHRSSSVSNTELYRVSPNNATFEK